MFRIKECVLEVKVVTIFCRASHRTSHFIQQSIISFLTSFNQSYLTTASIQLYVLPKESKLQQYRKKIKRVNKNSKNESCNSNLKYIDAVFPRIRANVSAKVTSFGQLRK